MCFSTNEKGNIYSLIMKKNGYSFPQALDFVANKLGLEKSNFNTDIKLPFGGFYKQILRDQQEPEYSIQTYSEEILVQYLNKYNLMFFNDGITFDVQRDYKVGYDDISCRITVPEYTFDGKLCGIMGRLLDKNCAKEERWLPIIPCSRSLTLYGYHKNYEYIQEKGLAIVGESEKLPQQLSSFECNIGLATCGNNVSPTQEKYLKGLLIPKTILAYDEGLEEEYLREQAKKLVVNNTVYKNSVGYIFDRDNTYLPKGSKASPSDYGVNIFKSLIKEKVVWI